MIAIGVLAGFVLLPVAPFVFVEWRRGRFHYRGTGLGLRNVVTGFLGAILVALSLQVITPPNLRLTSKLDPSSLTGRVVWNTRFEIAVIALGLLVGLALGNLGSERRAQGGESRPEDTAPPSPALVASSAVAAAPPAAHRPCPHCAAPMPRAAATCPHCQAASQAWTLYEGSWWVQTADGWYWLDDGRGAWNRWQPAAAAPSASA